MNIHDIVETIENLMEHIADLEHRIKNLEKIMAKGLVKFNKV